MTPSRPRRPSTSRAVSRGLVRLDGGPVLAQRGARGREGDRPEHVGAAGLVPRGAGGPPGLVLGDRGGGAAAGEVGLSGVEPVAPAREDPGAVGGVHLVPGEGDPVDVERREVEGPVGHRLRRVEEHPRPVPLRERGEALDRPQLARDVRRGGEHDERPAGMPCGAGGQRGERRLEQHLGVADAARHGQAHRVAGAPREQRRVVLGGEDEDRGVAGQRPGEQVDRVRGAAGEDDDVVLARPDEAGDLVARGLVVGARHPRQPARAAVHRRVGARRGLDGTGDPLERRRGCRMVEVRVVDEVAGQRGHEVGPHDGGQVLAGARLVAVRHARAGRGRDRRDGIRHGAQPRTAVEGGGGGAGDRHRWLRWSEDLGRTGIPRLPAPKGSPTRSSPGAPHRGGGLLASEPGLVAGTHDLRRRV